MSMKCHQTQPLISERRYLHTYMESTRNDHTSQTPPIPHRHHQTSALCPLPSSTSPPHLASSRLPPPQSTPHATSPTRHIAQPSPAQPSTSVSPKSPTGKLHPPFRFFSHFISSRFISFPGCARGPMVGSPRRWIHGAIHTSNNTV